MVFTSSAGHEGMRGPVLLPLVHPSGSEAWPTLSAFRKASEEPVLSPPRRGADGLGLGFS